MDPDGGFPDILGPGSHLSNDIGLHLFSRAGLLLNNSIYHANHLYAPGSLAIQEAFNCLSKFGGAFLLWLSTGSSFEPHHCSNSSQLKNNSPVIQVKHSTICRLVPGLRFGHSPKLESGEQLVFAKIVTSTVKHLWKEVLQLHHFPVLSLAAAFVPPFDKLSPRAIHVPLERSNDQLGRYLDQALCEGGCQGCPSMSLSNVSWIRDTVELKTGIKFPSFLCNPLAGQDDLHRITEILVGTGSRSMRIVRVKSIKLYAFGIYVHLDSVCEKLGPKYASVPVNELKDRLDFLQDLLLEDIRMTLRLVVTCNGVKISAVKEAFEKSLRDRLQKTNPGTDYHCLSAFGSYFNRDIPLPVGTTIDFRKTADGQLITEIGGKHIGAVRSKDLCRAFFDMYIGDSPVSMEAKQDLAQNVACLVRKC